MSDITDIVTMANGSKVYLDTESSHAATHLNNNPELLRLVKAFLKKQSFHEAEVAVEHDTGRTIGYMDLIETSKEDKIIYAIRQNREIFTRFAKNRKPTPTSYITIILRKDKNNNYELWSAWVGRNVPPFPGDPKETPESKPFWANHALVFGRQPIITETLTSKSPW